MDDRHERSERPHGVGSRIHAIGNRIHATGGLRRSRWVTYLALGTTLLLWATAFVAIRRSLPVLSPGGLALLRYTIASSVLLAYWLLASRRLPGLRDVPRMFLYGLLGVTAYNLGLNYGERTVTPGTASFVVGQIPIFTAIFATLILKEVLEPLAVLGIAVGFAGSAVLLFADSEGLSVNVGTLFVLVAVVSETLYFVLQKPTLRRYRPIELNVFVTVAGTILMLPFAADLASETARLDPGTTLAVVYLGVFPGAIGYFLWSFCLSRLPAFETATSLYVLPLLTIAVGHLWLGEMPTPLALTGGAIALLGAVVVNASRLGLGERAARRAR